MPQLTPLKTSFSSGELSPRLYGRTDAKGYAEGAAIMENFLADSRGPCLRRVGSRYIRSLTGNDGRVFTLSVDERNGYVFALTDYKLTPINYDGVPVHENYVLNPRFQEYAANWTVAEDNAVINFQPSACLISCNDVGNASGSIAQEVTVPASGDFRVFVGERLGGTYTVQVGTAAGDDTYGSFVVNGGNSSNDITLPGTTAWVTVLNDTRDSAIELSVVALLSDVQSAEFDTPWPESDLRDIHVTYAPGGFTVYFTHPNYPVWRLTYSTLTDAFVFEQVNFTSKPHQWTGTNWPRTGVFHDGRFYLGGTPNEPQQFWASKSGFPEDFTLGYLADEALTFTLSNRGDIRWMDSTKNLLIGTSLSEIIVTAQEGIITPGDIQVTQQSSYGSSRVQSQQVGDKIFYISADKRKLRAMQYEWSADNWLSQDLTFFSEHISASGIRATCWAQNPSNLFTCVLENGDLAMLTYERGEDIWGWHRHTFSDPVLDITVARVDGNDWMIGIVKRTDGTIYLELATTEVPDIYASEVQYMDSWIKSTNEDPVDSIVGLEHLEGRTVQVVVDGAVHPDRTVVGGSIELDYPGKVIYVGLQYVSKVVTLPLEKEQSSGSLMPYKKRFSKLYVSMLDSANPLINGKRQPTRYPSTPMNTAQPPRTGISEVGQLGWTDAAIVTIEQDLPLPCNIVSIYGELAAENL